MVLAGQVFRHYKQALYRVICVARHTETLERLVVYVPVTPPVSAENRQWAHPMTMFTADVVVDGKTVPRFSLVKKV